MSYLPDSDSEDELPAGWEEHATDEGLVCYINHQNKTTQWTHPRTGKVKRVSGDLPLGWERLTEPGSSRAAFRNMQTNLTTFVDPRLAFAVEEPPMDIAKVRQRFDGSTTALQVLHGRDLNGRLAILTGANCGIGYETARSLVMHGCEVIFACRNPKSTDEAIESIAKERPVARSRCRFVELNLASIRSVCKFVEEIKASVKHIDFLILNAGLNGLEYQTTEDDLEITFQVSHLSHFHLTMQLESLLDYHSRVVVLSSESHRWANLPEDNLTVQDLSPPRNKYWSMLAYNNAKLCNILFATELAQRWKNRGISVFSVHPGNMVSTQIQRNWWFYRFLFAMVRPFTKSVQQGAATTVYCATAHELTGLTGLYFNNCFFCPPSKRGQSETMRKQLWEISEQLIATIMEANKDQPPGVINM